MSFQICGDNRKSYIEAQVTFEDGDVLLCNPGLDYCSLRAYDLIQLAGPINTTGFLKNVYNVNTIPSFGSNAYGFIRRAGFKYYIHEDDQFQFNESFIITHVPDPDGKRYCEAWITYYPTANYQPQLLTGDDLLVTSTGTYMKPLVAPKLIQSINLPAAASAYWGGFASSTLYTGLKVDGQGDQLMLTSGPWAIIYEWNGSGYTEAYANNFGSTVTGYVKGNSALVLQSNTINWLVKSGTWSIDESITPWSGQFATAHAGGTGFYTFSTSAIWDLYDHDGNFVSGAEPSGDWSCWPATKWHYIGEAETGYGWLNQAWSVLGGTPFWALTFGKAGQSVTDYVCGSHSSWYGDFMYAIRDEDNYCYFSNRPLFMYIYPGGYSGMDPFTFTWSTYIYQQWNYHYLYYSDLSLDAPTSNTTGGYITGKYLVGWRYVGDTSGVFYCHTTQEVHRLYDYVFATHKIYSNNFYPVRTPNYSLVNNGDGTLKLLELKAGFFDTLSPVTATFTITSPTEITTTTDFTIPSQDAGCSMKFIISPDNTNWYKWGGSSWVTEADPTNGNDYTTFKSGCQSGYAPPAGTYTLYLKIAFYSTNEDNSPGWDNGECYMGLTTISTSNNAYLCDDSKVKIEHISDTETKFTSLMGQNVIISAQVNILAPPYNEAYED